MTTPAPLAVTTASLPPAITGRPYVWQLEATGGNPDDYTWEADGLPAGVELSAAGRLTADAVSQGEPVSVTFAVRSGAATAIRAMQWTPVPPPAEQQVTYDGPDRPTGGFTARDWTAPADCPPAIRVECWGSGAGGHNGTWNWGANGVGGGEYACEPDYPVTPGTAYRVETGSGGQGAQTRPAAGEPGRRSAFDNRVIANGGKPGIGWEGGRGGTGSDNTIHYDGGDGGSQPGGPGSGAGGGGAGGRSGPGGRGGDTQWSWWGAPGGIAGEGGGNGGYGGNQNTGGFDGQAPGGGGGGCGAQPEWGDPEWWRGGNGGTGRVLLSYTPVLPQIQPVAAGTVGVPMFRTLAATGRGPFTWRFSGAAGLPPGMYLAGGNIGGTPEYAGDYEVIAALTDAAGRTITAAVPVTVGATPPVITSAFPPATAGQPYSVTLTATGGTPPYAWSLSGLYPGLVLAGNVISGTPDSGGTWDVTVTVTDAVGGRATVAQRLVIEFAELTVVTTQLPMATAGQRWNAVLRAGGGDPPYDWTVEGLPEGIVQDRRPEVLTGMPLVPGVYPVTITATDDRGITATVVLQLPVAVPLPLQILTRLPGSEVMPGFPVGEQYAADLVAQGGVPPFAWTVTRLPPGLAVTSNTQITGRPDQPGRYLIRLEVTDRNGTTATVTQALYIATRPVRVVWKGYECSPGWIGELFTSVVTDVTGWYDTPPNEGNDRDMQLADGAAYGPKVLKAREITIEGAVVGPRADLMETRDILAGLAAEKTPVTLTIYDWSQGPRHAEVRADSDSFRHAWLGGHRAFTWEVTLTAADPRIYGDWQERVLQTLSGTDTGRRYQRSYPWRYRSGLTPNAGLLANLGNIDAPVLALYRGPLSQTRLQLGNGIITVNPLTEGETILVATDTLVATAPGGASRASYIRPGSRPLFIAPGQPRMWHLYGTGRGSVTLAWRSTWA